MHASDDTPLSMFLIDTAAARGTIDARNDERYVRARIAVAVSVFGFWTLAYAANALHIWPIAAVGIPLLYLGAWFFARRDRFRRTF